MSTFLPFFPDTIENRMIVVLIVFGYTALFLNIRVFMFYGDTVQDTRQMFFSSWDKYCQKQPLLPLEQQIAQVIFDHPEYQKIIEHTSKFQEHSYYPELGETNPFLHMGLHLAVREQVATNRPEGIHAAYNNLLAKYKDPLAVEHLIMDQLAECLWLSQKNNLPPDEHQYLSTLAQLAEHY